MKIKTGKLIGPALDWAVAKCEGKGIEFECPSDPWLTVDGISDQPLHSYTPSTDWAQGGPIIDEMAKGETFFIENDGDNVHVVFCETPHLYSSGYGPTILIAAMRCRVTSKLGDEVEVPDELIKGN